MAAHPFAIVRARQFGRFHQDTGGNVCELNFTSKETGSVSEISTMADRYLKERKRERDRVESPFAWKKEKNKKNQSAFLWRKDLRDRWKLLSCRGYRRRKIVHTFKATRVSRGFKRLSRLTLSPEQFKLLLFLRVCVGVGHIFARYFGERRLSELWDRDGNFTNYV